MKNSVLDELDAIVKEHYVFLDDEKDKWSTLVKRYGYLRDSSIGLRFYSDIQDMLREMNDAHLAINYQRVVFSLPDALVSLIDGTFYVLSNGALTELQKIQNRSLGDIEYAYKCAYPLTGESVIRHMILNDFYSSKFTSADRLTIGYEDTTHSVLQIKKADFHIKYSGVSLTRLARKIVDIPDSIAYIPLTSHDTAKSLNLSVPQKTVIVDLRNNSGGLVKHALDIVSNFMPFDVVMDSFHSVSQSEIEYLAVEGKASKAIVDKQFVLLVNEFTASSAEFIVARFIVENLRAITVGNHTPGISGQAITFMINENIPLTITTKKYVDHNGQILKKGISPDHIVLRSVKEINDGIDLQLCHAIRLLSSVESGSGVR